MLNVIKANTVCVKVYLLFLTCSMTNPSKKKLTNRNRGRLPLLDYISKHWTPVGSFLHAHCEDYIYSNNFVKYWHLMQKLQMFFFLIIHFFSQSRPILLPLFISLKFHSTGIWFPSHKNCHWNLEATSLVPSDQAAIVCINLMMV